MFGKFPVFARYWDLRSSTRSGRDEKSVILPRGQQPKYFAGRWINISQQVICDVQPIIYCWPRKRRLEFVWSQYLTEQINCIFKLKVLLLQSRLEIWIACNLITHQTLEYSLKLSLNLSFSLSVHYFNPHGSSRLENKIDKLPATNRVKYKPRYILKVTEYEIFVTRRS